MQSPPLALKLIHRLAGDGKDISHPDQRERRVTLHRQSITTRAEETKETTLDRSSLPLRRWALLRQCTPKSGHYKGGTRDEIVLPNKLYRLETSVAFRDWRQSMSKPQNNPISCWHEWARLVAALSVRLSKRKPTGHPPNPAKRNWTRRRWREGLRSTSSSEWSQVNIGFVGAKGRG